MTRRMTLRKQSKKNSRSNDFRRYSIIPIPYLADELHKTPMLFFD